MGNVGGFLRALFGAIIFVGFIGYLLVEVQASGGSNAATATTGNFKYLEVIKRERLVVHPDLDPNYMSKRRVPNGPDPIHNRRAGDSRRPPGRA